MHTCTQELCILDEEPFVFKFERFCFRASSEAILLSWEVVGCFGVFSFLPLFSPCFFSFSTFSFLIQAEVLWEFLTLQYLQNNLSLGTVQAADICPFFPQALQALVLTVAPLKRFFCLNVSESWDVLSIFTIKLCTSSHVDVYVIFS